MRTNPNIHATNASRIGVRSRILILSTALLLLSGCAPMSFLVTPVPGSRNLVEHELMRESIWAREKIAVIDLDGVLRNARPSSLLGQSGENPVSLLKEKLDRAAEDKHVKAAILRINSPGGGVTASDLMHAEIMRFKHKTGKPVIAAMMDVAASGGYYVACAADRIQAHPTTVTGSIGVIMIAPDFSGTMQKLGVKANIIKSADLKDAGTPFREMNDRDRAVFQGIIDAMYERFLSIVAAGRPGLARDKIRELADGRVYLAPEALKEGLIDDLGDLDDAVAAAKLVAGLENEPLVVVEYARPLSHRPNYYARGTASPTQLNLVNIELPEQLSGTAPKFMYLWSAGK